MVLRGNMKQHINYLAFLFVLLLAPFAALASLEPNKTNFLVITDIHLDNSNWFTMTINPSTANPLNDLDPATFETLLTEIDYNIKNGSVARPQFILIQGDISGHSRFVTDSVVKNESVVFSKLKTHFRHTPIFYLFGNNDSLKANYGVFYDPTHPGHDKSPYDIAKSQSGWLDGFLSTGTRCATKHRHYPCLITENTSNGYYSAYLGKELRLIALNSVLFSTKRVAITENEAANQLQWLATQLKAAKVKHDSVLIAMHVPPGNNVYDHSNFWQPKEQSAFLKLIKTYRHTIIGLLAGHTHAEELKVIKSSANKASPNQIITGLYFTAALSTSHGNAPSIKTFYLSKNNGQWLLSNYETFNFSEVGAKLKLSKLYDYTSYYCEHHERNLSECLKKISSTKMKKYFSAGNTNFAGVIDSPNDINLMVNN